MNETGSLEQENMILKSKVQKKRRKDWWN